MSDIWKDPRVVDALNDGRSVEDIRIADCPKCGLYGYYNEGSHFTCLDCDRSFRVCSEEESCRWGLCVRTDDVITLADTVSEEDGP